MNVISKLYFDVAPSLISQSPFAMTSAIVVLTTPSATLTLNQPPCLFHFGCGRLPPPDRLHTSIVHLLAVGVLSQLKQRRLHSHHPHLPLHPVCTLVFDVLKCSLFEELRTGLAQRQNVKHLCGADASQWFSV